MSIKFQKSGFTLIETLLYIAISATVLLSTVYFINILLSARVKNQMVTEVEDQGARMMTIIADEIRTGSHVTVLSPTSLSIQSLSGATSLITLNGTDLDSIQNGVSQPLNAAPVEVNAVYFGEKEGSSNSYQSIEFGITLTTANPGGRQEFSYQRTFLDAATLRNHL